MNKYITRWIIALLSLALIGLLCVQLYWVNNAIELKRELFRQSVNGAMSAVVSKLEKREVTAAVAQTVYAATAPTPDTVILSTPTSPERQLAPPTPPEPVADASEAEAPVAAYTFDTRSNTVPTYNSAGGFALIATPNTQLQSRSAHSIDRSQPTMSLSRNGVTNQRVAASGRVIHTAQPTQVQLVHLDSMRNIMRLYFDSTALQQHLRITQRMPRISVNQSRDRSSRIQHSLTVSTEWAADTAAPMQLQHMDNNIQLSINMPEITERIEHVQTMVNEMFDDPIVVQLSEPLTEPNQAVWMYEQQPFTYTQEQRAASASRPMQRSTAVTHTNRTPRSSTQSARKPIAQAVANIMPDLPSTQRSVHDRLVSIKDMASCVVAELATGMRPLHQRISPELLDSLLRTELAQRGIALPYRYAVLSPENTFALATPATYTKELRQSAFRTALFPNDIISAPYILSLYFPGQEEFVYESMWGVLGTSLLFILLILGCFSFTLITLARQKKLSDMKTDFINNMTHELKTPIATISLASEALRDPAVRSNDNRVMRFINAIYEENRRLGSQVERVLQAAVVDRGEVRINPSTVCVHDIMSEALQTIALQVESRGGTVECHFDAEHDCIQADRIHLANMIVNLLDNANKYSPDSPRIVLSTSNTSSGVVIAVEDNGIGMSRDAQKRIFEQFYRVSTGNLHDVKGFGLGLSYVKAMVEAHGGTISVRSELRQGSRFELYLPFVGKETLHT